MTAPEHLATDTPNLLIANPAVRKAIYGLAAAVGALLVVVGVSTPDQVQAWLVVVGNVLTVIATVLALVNTPKQAG